MLSWDKTPQKQRDEWLT